MRHIVFAVTETGERLRYESGTADSKQRAIEEAEFLYRTQLNILSVTTLGATK